MRFIVEPIDCDNDAFGEIIPGIEVARILRELAERLDNDMAGAKGVLRDVNGNVVSSWRFEP